jgi:hypothetical protein
MSSVGDRHLPSPAELLTAYFHLLDEVTSQPLGWLETCALAGIPAARDGLRLEHWSYLETAEKRRGAHATRCGGSRGKKTGRQSGMARQRVRIV